MNEVARIERLADSMVHTRPYDPSPPPAFELKQPYEQPSGSNASFKVFIDGRELALGIDPDVFDRDMMIPITKVAWELGRAAVNGLYSEKTGKKYDARSFSTIPATGSLISNGLGFDGVNPPHAKERGASNPLGADSLSAIQLKLSNFWLTP